MTVAFLLLLLRSPHADVHTSLLYEGSSFAEILWAAIELCLQGTASVKKKTYGHHGRQREFNVFVLPSFLSLVGWMGGVGGGDLDVPVDTCV